MPSTLDIILTTCPQLITCPVLKETSSDHKLVLFNNSISVKTHQPLIRKGRSFKNYSKLNLLYNLDMTRLNALLFSTDVNLVASTLVNEINKALDVVAPNKATQIRTHYAPHLSSNTKEIIEQRNKAKEKARMTKMKEDHET